ncbi:MAG: FMN-binding protein [Bacillota bacterium]|nr:FMN-binding protein [Bacillota bacterium]MDW7677566.1 FMN-binding protein [Bacillota bacterium]
MIRRMRWLLFLLVIALMLAGCTSAPAPEEPPEEPVEETPAPPPEPVEVPAAPEPPPSGFDDGVYRGTYGDVGDQQVSIQFTLTDGVISNVGYRHLFYGATDFRQIDEDNPMYAIKEQHDQVAAYLEGKPLSVMDELYSPGDFVDDIDTLTGATLRGNKIYSAMMDALNRGVYTPAGAVYKNLPQAYDDGTYRGLYEDGGFQQLGVQFTLTDGIISDVSYRRLFYAETDFTRIEETDPMYPITLQHQQVAEYLEGLPVEDIFDLYTPHEFVDDIDAFSGATLRGNKIFSAFKDGLNRGVYSPTDGVTTDIGPYPDGRYRGVYSDGGNQQIGIQFNLENGNLTDLTFRYLYYANISFLDMAEDDPMYPILVQYEQALAHLEGQPLAVIFDLYEPGEFVEDIDTYTGATLRGNKLLSAIRDGLNRGIY